MSAFDDAQHILKILTKLLGTPQQGSLAKNSSKSHIQVQFLQTEIQTENFCAIDTYITNVSPTMALEQYDHTKTFPNYSYTYQVRKGVS